MRQPTRCLHLGRHIFKSAHHRQPIMRGELSARELTKHSTMTCRANIGSGPSARLGLRLAGGANYAPRSANLNQQQTSPSSKIVASPHRAAAPASCWPRGRAPALTSGSTSELLLVRGACSCAPTLNLACVNNMLLLDCVAILRPACSLSATASHNQLETP